MTSKICFLTGATSGIGQAAAIELAEKGYKLYLAARSERKALATEKRIRAHTPEAHVTWLFGDLSRLDDVNKIADEFLERRLQIDLLFLNAGLCTNRRVITEDGHELMFAVNHLAPFLLTQRLMERLTEGNHPLRVVITASGAYSFVKGINFDDPTFTKGFKTFRAYGNSKLANILFTRTLSEKLKAAAPNKKVTVNCFHPGFVGTGIGTQQLLGRIVMSLCRPFVRSPVQGAETGLFLALDPSVEGKSGEYYFDCKVQKTARYARDDIAAQKLWDKSEEWVSA